MKPMIKSINVNEGNDVIVTMSNRDMYRVDMGSLTDYNDNDYVVSLAKHWCVACVGRPIEHFSSVALGDSSASLMGHGLFNASYSKVELMQSPRVRLMDFGIQLGQSHPVSLTVHDTQETIKGMVEDGEVEIIVDALKMPIEVSGIKSDMNGMLYLEGILSKAVIELLFDIHSNDDCEFMISVSSTYRSVPLVSCNGFVLGLTRTPSFRIEKAIKHNGVHLPSPNLVETYDVPFKDVEGFTADCTRRGKLLGGALPLWTRNDLKLEKLDEKEGDSVLDGVKEVLEYPSVDSRYHVPLGTLKQLEKTFNVVYGGVKSWAHEDTRHFILEEGNVVASVRGTEGVVAITADLNMVDIHSKLQHFTRVIKHFRSEC